MEYWNIDCIHVSNNLVSMDKNNVAFEFFILSRCWLKYKERMRNIKNEFGQAER